jgi:predicted small lipoprotein YifL
LGSLVLAGCGRIGPLEPPPDANAPPKPAAAPSTAESLTPMVKPSIPPLTAPRRSFFLDPLLR